MAKSKVEYWLTSAGLALLAGWARNGLTEEQIAKNCGIKRQTLYEWKKKYPDINDTVKKNKEIVDYEVENALLEKCIGYNTKVTKNFKVKKIIYSETGKKISEIEELVEKQDEVHIPADTTAQIFWLRNRMPNEWRDKPQITDDNDERVIIVNDLPKENN